MIFFFIVIVYSKYVNMDFKMMLNCFFIYVESINFCFLNRFKILMVFGDCFCDYLILIWCWFYFVFECWVCCFIYCLKWDRGEVWFVNWMRMLCCRLGFLCLNKEDFYFLGVYFFYFFILIVCVFFSFMGMYNCFILFFGKMRLVFDIVCFVYGFIILNKI